jgi:HD-GYP domain-containing protein (c-di-GMP phosphodiesterase class II)
LTHRLCDLVGEKQLWLIDIAAMLSQLGCVTVPPEILHRVHSGEEVHPSELKMYHRHPEVAVKLISAIPRLDEIARIIAYQEKHFDGSGTPADSIAGSDIPLGSRALKLASDWDGLAMRKMPQDEVESVLRERQGWYDPALLEVLPDLMEGEDRYVLRELPLQHLTDTMIIAEDIQSFQEMLLCCRGQEVTPTLRMRLLNHVDKIGPINSVNVLIPEVRVTQATDEESRYDRFGRKLTESNSTAMA